MVTIPTFSPRRCITYSVAIAGRSSTGIMMANMPNPHRQRSTNAAPRKPLIGTVTTNGSDKTAPKKPRHCSGVKSPTMMSLSKSSPDFPMAVKQTPTVYAAKVLDVAPVLRGVKTET